MEENKIEKAYKDIFYYHRLPNDYKPVIKAILYNLYYDGVDTGQNEILIRLLDKITRMELND